MERHNVPTAIATLSTDRLGTRRVRSSVVGLGLLGILLGGSRSAAQTPAGPTSLVPGRLTVRPREMATGTRNAQAGEQSLDSLKDYLVYVPQQCVGTRRCPLVVYLPGGGEISKGVMARERPRADKYGMILFVPNPVNPGRWDLVVNVVLKRPGGGSLGNMIGLKTASLPPEAGKIDRDPNVQGLVREMPYNPDVRNLDAALKEILGKFAIAPDKIALTGASDGGSYALFVGRNNLDIFSRIAPRSPAMFFVGDSTRPRNPNTQFLVTGGMGEFGLFLHAMKAGQQLEQDGHSVKRLLGLREHDQRAEDHEYIWRWLQESWSQPNPATGVVPDSVPLLTPEALTQTAAFWTSFMAEPDSIRTTARLAHLKEVGLLVGQKPAALLMTDIPVLAAKYPSVAAALKTAGLTAQQYQAYRLALVSAKATKMAGAQAGTVEAGSVLAKNVEFLDAHQAELRVFDTKKMWITP